MVPHLPQYTRSKWVAMKMPGPQLGHCFRRRVTLPESSTCTAHIHNTHTWHTTHTHTHMTHSRQRHSREVQAQLHASGTFAQTQTQVQPHVQRNTCAQAWAAKMGSCDPAGYQQALFHGLLAVCLTAWLVLGGFTARPAARVVSLQKSHTSP